MNIIQLLNSLLQCEIHLIWAEDKNGGIGCNGKLPAYSEDLKNFKSITMDSTIIMGRKTWDSLPIKPLPNRNNIILSSKKQTGGITFNNQIIVLTI